MVSPWALYGTHAVRHLSGAQPSDGMQILSCKAEVDDIMPYIKAFNSLVRRRPFLVQRLEEVLKKLLTSLEFFDEDGRQKIAIGAPLETLASRIVVHCPVCVQTCVAIGLLGQGPCIVFVRARVQSCIPYLHHTCSPSSPSLDTFFSSWKRGGITSWTIRSKARNSVVSIRAVRCRWSRLFDPVPSDMKSTSVLSLSIADNRLARFCAHFQVNEHNCPCGSAPMDF